jgi:hypothetical protein
VSAPLADWPNVLERGKDIVLNYGTPVTLRQLFYRLVAEGLLRNQQNVYEALSGQTRMARVAGTFPSLIDPQRPVDRVQSFSGPDDALDHLARSYRRDRTEGQDVAVWIGVEKATLSEQLRSWFWPYGLPIVATRGYASQPLVEQVQRDVRQDGRPAVLLYAGDHDPSGEDIDRHFVECTGCFDEVVRVALSAAQVAHYGVPPTPGKAGDSRSAAFIARNGQLVQVELEALDPNDLRDLYLRALEPYWDDAAYRRSLAQERADLMALNGGER